MRRTIHFPHNYDYIDLQRLFKPESPILCRTSAAKRSCFCLEPPPFLLHGARAVDVNHIADFLLIQPVKKGFQARAKFEIHLGSMQRHEIEKENGLLGGG